MRTHLIHQRHAGCAYTLPPNGMAWNGMAATFSGGNMWQGRCGQVAHLDFSGETA